MKKLFALIFLLTSLLSISQAPTFQWAKKYSGPPSSDYAYGIKSDGAGNLITVGRYYSTVDFDPGPGIFTLTPNGNSDIYISKLDANGNFIWAKSIGGSVFDEAFDVATDASNNIYVTGTYAWFNVDFDPGPGTYTMTSNGGSYDIFVLKLSSAGNFLWAKSIGGTTSDDGRAIDVDAAGNCFFTGKFEGTAVDFDPGPGTFTMNSSGSQDSYITKLDANGNFVWAKQLGGSSSSDYGWDIEVDVLGNIFSTGYFGGSNIDFDPGPGVSPITGPVYVNKFDNAGNFLWAKGYGASFSHGITLDGSSNVYVAGRFSNASIDFDPGPGTFLMTALASNNDIYIQKLDALGNFVWAKQIGAAGNDQPNSIDCDASGNLTIGGGFTNVVDFDPSVATFTLNSSSGISCIFQLNSVGNFLWAGQITDGLEEVTLDNYGSLYCSASFGGTVDFDPTVGVATLTTSGAGDSDAAFFKLALCNSAPSQPTIISGANNFCYGTGTQNYSITIVPNAISYSWSLPGGWTGTSTTNVLTTTVGISGGNISVSAINACGASSAQVLTVTVNPSPTITVNSGSICSGNSFTMNASGANSYTYQGGNAVVNPTSNTSYTVVGTNTLGCNSNIATSNVTVNPNPTVTAISNASLLCVGQTATLTASGASAYTWSPGGAGNSIVVSPTVNTTYLVNGTDINGCNNTYTITQSVSPCTGISQMLTTNTLNVYPNPFNNKITITSDVLKQTLIIYNLLGSLVYNTLFEGGNIEIDLSHLPNGIYFIKIGSFSKKIIKE